MQKVGERDRERKMMKDNRKLHAIGGEISGGGRHRKQNLVFRPRFFWGGQSLPFRY
jgi:hypothetical protein